MTEPALGADFDIHIAEAFEQVYRKAKDFRAADTYFLDRVGSAIFYRIPQLLSLGRNLSTMNAIEIGCGRGTKSICWAPLFKTYHGFDLDPTLIEEARYFGNLVSSDAQFSIANIAKVLADPTKFGITERVDCIIAYAVIEHLTLSEREAILSASREILNGHGLLIICEAPNRLIREDPHSSALPFFQMLPSKLARKYISRSSRPEAKALANGTKEQFSRFGTGVSYHEFDLFLEDQRGDLPAIVGGGWDFWAASDEPIRPDEVELETYMQAAAVPAHPAFSRYWIDVIFDFQTTEPRDAYKRPLLLGAELSGGVSSSGPTRWALTSYRSEGAPLEFAMGSHVPLYAQFDLNECRGEFVISDQEGATTRSFAVETLRASKFPRWHSRAQIDLSAFRGATHIRITPAHGRVATDGIIAV